MSSIFGRLFLITLAIVTAGPFSVMEVFGDERPVKIGVVASLSGEWAREGSAFREGIDLGLQRLTEEGRSIQLIIEDSQLQNRITVGAVQKLITQDGVDALIISSLTETKPVAQIIEKAKIPTLVLWDAGPELDELGEYIFGIGGYVPGGGERCASYAYRDLGVRNAAIISNNRQWSQDAARYFREAFKREGGQIVFDQEILPSESDFRGVALRLKSSHADLVYAPLEDNFVATIKALWQVKAVPRFMTSDVLSEDFIKAFGPVAEGFLYSQTVAPESAVLDDLQKRYAKRYNRPLETTELVAWGYDGIGVLADAIKGSATSGRGLKEELAETRDYRGASDVITFSSGGSVKNYPSMYQVKNRKLQLLAK